MLTVTSTVSFDQGLDKWNKPIKSYLFVFMIMQLNIQLLLLCYKPDGGCDIIIFSDLFR